MTLLIADDHFAVLVGLKAILQGDPQGRFHHFLEASTLAETRDLLAQNAVDLVLVDIQFPDGSGLDLVKDLGCQRPELPVLVLSMHQEGSFVLRALQNGAKGFLGKNSADSVLLNAVAALAAGQVFLDPACLNALAGTLRQLPEWSDPLDYALRDLTVREREVFDRLARGETSKTIAYELGLSSKTIDNHRVAIFAKLNLSGPADLMRWALEKKPTAGPRLF